VNIWRSYKSKITYVWRTETVTDCCCVHKQTDVSSLSTNIKLLSTSFDLLNWQTDLCHRWLTDCWPCTAFCCNIFFFVTAVVWGLQSIMGFLYGWCKHHFVRNLRNEYFTRKYFRTVFWVAKSYVAVSFNYFLSIAIFDIDSSQGSVSTYVRCGWTFKYAFVANLPLSLPVKEFWKSVNTRGSYGQEFIVLFFDSQCSIPWFRGGAAQHYQPLVLCCGRQRVINRETGTVSERDHFYLQALLLPLYGCKW